MIGMEDINRLNGNGFVIEATLTGVNGAPLSGNVIVTVAGKEYTVKVTDGKGIATGDKLAANYIIDRYKNLVNIKVSKYYLPQEII